MSKSMKNILITCMKNPFAQNLAAVFSREGYEVFTLFTLDADTHPLRARNIDPPIEVCQANSNHPPKRGDCDTSIAERFNWCRNIFKKTQKLDFLADTSDYHDDEDTFAILSGLCAHTTPIAVCNAKSGMEKTFRYNVIQPQEILEAFKPLLDAGENKRLFYVSSASASINETYEATGYAYKMSKAALHQFLQMKRNELAPFGYTFRVFDPMPGKIDPKAAAESAFLYITRRRGTENNDPNRDDETNLVLRDAMGRQHSW
ncbi:MAG: hypothetical protein FWF79_05090 [Defluviitaleaceae bacterium]|nr:hypothetical protein [Defluviitaleaceae bacterium]